MQGARNLDTAVKFLSRFGDNVLKQIDNLFKQGDQAIGQIAKKFSLNGGGNGVNIRIPEIPLSTSKRFNEIDIVDYTKIMSKNYTEEDIARFIELTTHNGDSKTALLGYFEPNSSISYEQIAHANGWTYFDAGNDGWNAMAKIDPQLATKVNEEFLIKQIKEGKDFILTSDPYKAGKIFRETRKGESYVKELLLLRQNGYKIEKYGNFWRAYK